jgi:hypothetical protein
MRVIIGQMEQFQIKFPYNNNNNNNNNMRVIIGANGTISNKISLYQ